MLFSPKHSQRPLNPRQRLLFPDHFQQMIQARAGGVAGAGEADGMHEHAGFHAEFAGDGFQRGFEGRCVERVGFGKGVAEFFEARFIFGHETFLPPVQGLGAMPLGGMCCIASLIRLTDSSLPRTSSA